MERLLETSKMLVKLGFPETGLLIFCAVAEPRNSGKSAKSRGIHKNTKNTAKFGRNLIHVCTTYLKLMSAIGAIYLP